MKTAIYIEDGTTQIVLTPQSDWEKKAIAQLEQQKFQAALFAGSFYDCRGGWVRQEPYDHAYTYGHEASRDYSLIVRIAQPGQQEPPHEASAATEPPSIPTDAYGRGQSPHGYAYRYHDALGDVLRFNGGVEVNGGKPFECLPYWLGEPLKINTGDDR